MPPGPAGIPGRAGLFLGTMMKEPNAEFDDRECYCRVLGHHLHFSYCRSINDGYPCYKVLDCWFEKFDVRRYVQENFTGEEVEAFLKAPMPKVQTLVALIEKARSRVKED